MHTAFVAVLFCAQVLLTPHPHLFPFFPFFTLFAPFSPNPPLSSFSILARLPSVIFCAYVAGMQGTHLPNTMSALENVRKAFSLISTPDVGGVDQPKSANFAVQSGRIDIKGVRFA